MAWLQLGLGLAFGAAGSLLGMRWARGHTRAGRWSAYFKAVAVCFGLHLVVSGLLLLVWVDLWTWALNLPSSFLFGGALADAQRVLRARRRRARAAAKAADPARDGA